MKIITAKITLSELSEMSKEIFGNLVKAVVDIKKGIMAVNAELHADEEALLIAHGSRQEDLWGINLYPEMTGEDFIEFDSMINLKPAQGNRARGVESAALQERIRQVVKKLVVK